MLCNICSLTMSHDALGRCSRMVVESEAMKKLLVRTATVARTSAPVIILGESGTGKEVLARALHANGPRKDRPFVAINVAALPSELLESELFGHARGAFTGAVAARKGLMEAADGGTLFLDEIGEMPLALQAKLLRALQDGEVRPVGGVRSFRVDLRVVCATHRDLAQLVAAGLFREDLYYRIKVFVLRVPPLRNRVADIAPLSRMFLAREKCRAELGPEAIALLEGHSWPGNVRELQNAMTHAAALCEGPQVLPEHLPEDLKYPSPILSMKTKSYPSLVPSQQAQGGVQTLAVPIGGQHGAVSLHSIGLGAFAKEAEGAALMSHAPASHPSQLPASPWGEGQAANSAAPPAEPPVRLEPLAKIEKEHVEHVLEAVGGNQVEAAKILGIGRNTLWRKLKAWNESAEQESAEQDRAL